MFCGLKLAKLRFCYRLFSTVNFKSLQFDVHNKVATITLNRENRLNAIDEFMPEEIEQAVKMANLNDQVRVILIKGKGDHFCSGYDLKIYAEAERGSQKGSQLMPWDPLIDWRMMHAATECFMALWRSEKPTVASIKGACVAGGTDIALVCDVTLIADDARIGYPPARLWGCPTTAMWVYRVGVEQAKRLLFTGDLISGRRAAQIGLVGESFPVEDLDAATTRILNRMKSVPANQLFFQKQVINNAVEMMGLGTSQRLATFFDGATRHTPEGVRFQQRCFDVGFRAAVAERDRGEN